VGAMSTEEYPGLKSGIHAYAATIVFPEPRLLRDAIIGRFFL